MSGFNGMAPVNGYTQTQINEIAEQIRTDRGVINSLSSDTEMIDFPNGSYQISLNADSAYLPARWGTLTVNKSDNVYGSFIFITTEDPAKMYIRHAHLTSKAWYSDWVMVYNKAQVDGIIANKAIVAKYQVAQDVSSVTIPLTETHMNIVTGFISEMGWAYPSTDLSSGGLYWFAVRPSQNDVGYIPIIPGALAAFRITSMSYANGNLTINFETVAPRFINVIYG